MNLLKQRNPGKLLGGLKEMAGRISFYVQIINLCLLTVTFWNTASVQNIKNTQLQWLSFWHFLIVLVILVVVVSLIEYKYIMPSSYDFGTDQFIKHSRFQKQFDDIEKIKKKLGIDE